MKAIILISPVGFGVSELENHVMKNIKGEIIHPFIVENGEFISLMKDSVAFEVCEKYTSYYTKRKIRNVFKECKIPIFTTNVYQGFHLKEYFKEDASAILTKYSTLDIHKEKMFSEILGELNEKSLSNISSQYYSDHLFDKTVILDDLADAKNDLLTHINNHIK